MASLARQGRAPGLHARGPHAPGQEPGAGPAGAEVRVASPQACVLLPATRRELAGMLLAMRRKAEALFRQGRCPGCPAAVELAVLGDGAMSALNRRAMGAAGPTNILSFPAAEASAGGRASLALSSAALVRESLLYGQRPAEHLARLLAHGMAHVCGFDHGPAMDAFAGELEAEGLAQLAEAEAAGAEAAGAAQGDALRHA